jgi:hypothetical protein
MLKTLYESLVDPEQRHDLGEYYTPDWLAQRVTAAAVAAPLAARCAIWSGRSGCRGRNSGPTCCSAIRRGSPIGT